MATEPTGTNGLTTLDGDTSVALVSDIQSVVLAVDTAITQAKSEANTGDTSTLSSAKTYTDGQLSPERQRIGTLESNKWKRTVTTALNNLDNITTSGEYELSHYIPGRPFGQSGIMEVFSVDGNVVQQWTTRESSPRKFVRSRSSAGVWNSWQLLTWRGGGISSTEDLNNFQTPGYYEATNGPTLNKPIAGTGVLEVFKVSSGITVQRFLTLEGTQREFTRRTQSGVWSEWQALNWYQGVLIQGMDFNSLQVPGESSVTFIDHPNQPVPSAGSVTVKRAGSELTQEFTPLGDNPPVFRRRLNGLGWSTWVNRSISTTDAPAGVDDSPTRGPVELWEPTLTTVNPSQYITELSLDRTVAFNGSNSFGTIRESRDDGATWTDLHTFAGSFGSVQTLDNGELLATVMNDPSPRELWLSEGYGKGGPVTWSKVLTASGPYITFIKAWSFGIHKNIILVNEYGPKTGMQWLGNDVTQNARYTYMSLDYGKTWSTVFDLNEYLTTQQGRANTDGVHLHGVTWDPYWDRIWITFGDDSNGTVYSDDLGETWQTAHYAAEFSGGYQNVGIIALPKAILFGSDCYPNGVHRINRTAGKHSGTYTIDVAYTINPGVNDLTHLCQAIRKVERTGGDGPVIFGFSAETATVPSHMVVTYDGFTFTKLWEDSVAQTPGRGLRTIAGPTLKGELIVGSNDGRDPAGWSRWTGPVQIY